MGDFGIDYGRHGIWVAGTKERLGTHFPNGERTRTFSSIVWAF